MEPVDEAFTRHRLPKVIAFSPFHRANGVVAAGLQAVLGQLARLQACAHICRRLARPVASGAPEAPPSGILFRTT